MEERQVTASNIKRSPNWHLIFDSQPPSLSAFVTNFNTKNARIRCYVRN